MPDIIITPSTGKLEFIDNSAQTTRRHSFTLDHSDGLVLDAPLSAAAISAPLNVINVTVNNSNANYPFVLAQSGETGAKNLLMDGAGGTYNPFTNTATIDISGNSATTTLASNSTNLGGVAAASYVTLTGTQTLTNKTITGTFTGNLTGTGSWATNAVSAVSATTATNSTQLNGQAASYYTNIPARLGYTPVNQAGDTISGNLTVNGNFAVNGSVTAFSASNIYITSSNLTVTDNILLMNALSPYQRYAGIQMYDSGSGTLSQFLWDGEGDYFFLTGSSVNGKIITGPDGQTNLTSGYIPKATAGYKLGNSLIYDNGTNIGIGTTSPGAKLDVVGSVRSFSSAGNYGLITNGSFQAVGNHGGTFMLDLDNTGEADLVNIKKSGVSRFYIKNNGNIGIGTTNPSYKLEVYSGAKTSAFTGLSISNFNNYDGTAASLVTSQLRFAILENDTGTYNAPARTFAILESGNEVNNSSSDGFFAISTRRAAVVSEKFRITSTGNTIISGSLVTTSSISAYSTITATNTLYIQKGVGGYLSYITAEQTAASTGNAFKFWNSGGNTLLTITYDGNFGIGTTSTAQKLDVVGNIRCVPVSSAWAEGLSFSMPTTSSWGGLRWRRERANADGNHYIGYVGTDTTDDLVFGSNNAGTQIDNNIRITKAGLVGVGTSSPAAKFHVVGVISGSSFSGAGTGLTGTAASLTVGTATTATSANALNASNNYQVNSIGVNIAGSGTAGRIGTNENGVRSWTITPTGGRLVFDSGDGNGSAIFGFPVTASTFVGAGTGLTGTAANLTVGTALNVGNGTITIAAGTGVGVGTTNTFTTNQSGATTVTISNTGVTSAVAGTGVSVSGATGAVTFSIGQSVGTGNTPTFAGATLNGQLNVNHSVSTAIVRLWNAGSTVWSLGVGDTAGSYFNISADFGSILINKTNGNIWISGSGINNTVLHSGTTSAPNLSIGGNAATATTATNANAISFTEVELNAPVTVSGTWTTGNGSEWGEPKFGTSFNQFRYTDGNGPYVEYNIPANHHSCFISQLQWDTGGYADCHGVQADGDLVFLRRINTRQLVENSNHGNTIQHDGATVTFVGSGLQAFTKIRITNRLGRIHMTGIAFTRQVDDGYEGTGMVHPAQISHQGAGSGLDADLLDGYSSATANTANTIVLRDASGNFSAGTITATLNGNVSGTAGGETLGTVTGRGGSTGTQILVATAAGQAMFVGRQAGAGYSYGSAGIFTAQSDNPNGGSNFFFQGFISSSATVASGNLTFSIRADGQIYTTMNTATGIANNSFNVAKTILGSIHIANGSGTSGNNNQAAITFQGGSSSEAQAGIYVSNNNSSGTAMGFATTDSYTTGPQLFMTATNTGVVNFSRARPTYAGNALVDVAGGQTIAGITYFSNGESMNVYGIRGRFTNEYLHLYNKVGIGHPGGWGQGEGSTPNQGLSTYGGITIAYGTNATSIFYGNVGIGTTVVNARVESYYSSNAITFNYLATNLNVNSPIPVYGFDVTSGAESRSIKAGIGYERHLPNGRGTLHFYNDSTNDTQSLAGNRTTAGDIKMSLDNSGNLGIGTTQPSWLLTVYAASAPQFTLQNGTRSFVLTNNAGDNLLSFNYGSVNRLQFDTTNQWFNTGNLGVGNTSPQYKLHVTQATPSGQRAAPANTSIQVDSNTNNYISLVNTADNGTYAGLTFVDNNIGGYIVFRNYTGDVTTGSDSLIYGTFQDHIFQNSSSETINGKTETMRIKQNGNVGIGSNNPQSKLDVNGVLAFGGVAVLNTANNGNDIYANVRVIRNTSSTSADGMYINYDSAGTTAAHLRFYANAGNERMRIQANDGNVGIGTTSAGRRLDVEGIVRTRGASGSGGFEIGAATTGAAKWRIEWDSASDSLDFNWVG